VDRDIAGKVVTDAIQAQDRTLGLDLPAAAAVASVVASAVRSGDTPNECKASIAVTLGGNGKVQAVSLVGYAGGGGGEWRAVAASVKSMLKSRTFTMKKAFEKGAIITVAVNSLMQMPAGGSGGLHGMGLSFDTSNIGARPTRQVTTGVTVQAIR